MIKLKLPFNSHMTKPTKNNNFTDRGQISFN